MTEKSGCKYCWANHWNQPLVTTFKDEGYQYIGIEEDKETGKFYIVCEYSPDEEVPVVEMKAKIPNCPMCGRKFPQ